MLAPESERARPEQGEYSQADLIGCEVWTPDGERRWASCAGVEEYGGRRFCELRSRRTAEMLIPFARAICGEIDVARKIIRVELPEGLADLNR